MAIGEVAGIFSFEFPTGRVEARIKTPPFFDTFVKRAESEDFTAALANLRRTYQPLREAFRTVADAFLKCPGGELVASDMVGTEIEVWNGYVDRVFGASDEALLLKSEVLAVEIHAGAEDAELRRTLQDRIKAHGPLLRFVPPQSFLRYSRKSRSLSSLNIKNVIPFERKLFRIGGRYRNKRSVLHRGIASMISFRLSAGAQLTQASLNDPAIRAFGEERLPHLYMVCTRPRIMVKSMIPEGTALPLFDHVWTGGFSEHQISALKHSDLEVIYIGQSKGRDFDRTAITRLDRHEKWDIFYRHIAEENPHQEIWIILLSQSASHHLNMTIPGVHGGDHDAQELMRRTRNPARIDASDGINFIEAALISYFKPRYNDKFTKGAFPSQKHESYERLFITPMDVAAIELETWTSIGCRLHSESVAPRFVHLKTCQFNAAFDMGLLFPKA